MARLPELVAMVQSVTSVTKVIAFVSANACCGGMDIEYSEGAACTIFEAIYKYPLNWR